MRLEGKVGIVVGAGQSPGETVGTGRAAALLFAREGARVLLADRVIDSARETAKLIAAEGGVAECVAGDWTSAEDCRSFAAACVEAWGRIDFVQNNVGIGGGGDGPPRRMTEEAFDRIIEVNLKGCVLSCQAVVPVMREQQSGSIVNISSVAALAAAVSLTAYKISKAGINALTQSLAIENASRGVRVNTIMPGLLDTPMAIDSWAEALGHPREEVRAERDALVPLRHKMGSAWDVANASVFLHSDEAGFITGVALPVDGGQLARVG
ncbi:MAG TPA: SDR family NAD(P)-dependent oxidoreductase [Solirubrobacteraceae bacterium]|nr:SDR family NAD(P)-dependent oxidoreductase [Solirubrobacteraceae bacterium]